MKNEQETKERLLVCAREEFLEKGYQKASLRSICRKAGVTTGALYFFFENKEDLFAAIVQPTIEQVRTMATQHVKQELMMLQNIPGADADNMHDDYNATQQILHVLYQNYDICQLLLAKSQGSQYENTIDEFVEIFENGQRLLAVEQAKQLNVQPPDEDILHWVVHIEMDAYVHVLLHEKNEQKALKHMGKMLEYLASGWKALFQKQE